MRCCVKFFQCQNCVEGNWHDESLVISLIRDGVVLVDILELVLTNCCRVCCYLDETESLKL